MSFKVKTITFAAVSILVTLLWVGVGRHLSDSVIGFLLLLQAAVSIFEISLARGGPLPTRRSVIFELVFSLCLTIVCFFLLLVSVKGGMGPMTVPCVISLFGQMLIAFSSLRILTDKSKFLSPSALPSSPTSTEQPYDITGAWQGGAETRSTSTESSGPGRKKQKGKVALRGVIQLSPGITRLELLDEHSVNNQVELRIGTWARGIRVGDTLQVKGIWEAGQYVTVTEIFNESTNVEIKRKSVAPAVLLLIVIIIVVIFASTRH